MAKVRVADSGLGVLEGTLVAVRRVVDTGVGKRVLVGAGVAEGATVEVSADVEVGNAGWVVSELGSGVVAQASVKIPIRTRNTRKNRKAVSFRAKDTRVLPRPRGKILARKPNRCVRARGSRVSCPLYTLLALVEGKHNGHFRFPSYSTLR